MAESAALQHAPRIVVGVTGGIAAYKAVSVVRELVSRGCDVTVIPTHSALLFVGIPTWEAVSRNVVHTGLFDGVAEVRHVLLGQSADLIVVAPATANALASFAAGLAGDLLGTTLLATTAPVLVAPAMHTEMWFHPSVQENMQTLRARGVHVIGPESGPLTGGDEGVGRMSEPTDIADYALSLLKPRLLEGKSVVISAGGTREPLDPVRYIGNQSTGHMGIALAKEALRLGATVTLVAAHLDTAPPPGVAVIHAPTHHAMREQMLSLQPKASFVVMAAAVADWLPAAAAPGKMTKQELGDTWTPVLHQASDILAELGTRKPADQVLVGFSAETEPDEVARVERGREKMRAKGADAMVVNQVGDGVGFGAVETAVTLISTASPQSLSVEGTKDSVAERLWEALLDR